MSGLRRQIARPEKSNVANIAAGEKTTNSQTIGCPIHCWNNLLWTTSIISMERRIICCISCLPSRLVVYLCSWVLPSWLRVVLLYLAETVVFMEGHMFSVCLSWCGSGQNIHMNWCCSEGIYRWQFRLWSYKCLSIIASQNLVDGWIVVRRYWNTTARIRLYDDYS